jgi:S1-C subfamily serine protease
MMRRLLLGGMFVLVSVLARPALAGWVYQLNSDDSLSWRIADHALKLHSDNTSGITVTKVGTAPVWGLHEGDVIVAVDDHSLKHVSELMNWLRTSKPATVVLHVRRAGAPLALSVTAAEYGQVISPIPPPPPEPQPPPPTIDSGRYTYEHTTDDSLSWRNTDHALQLTSSKATGITVTKVVPESLWGLQDGDVITAADGTPLKNVSELMDRFRASRPAAVKLQLRRGGSSVDITVAAVDYADLISPALP